MTRLENKAQGILLRSQVNKCFKINKNIFQAVPLTAALFLVEDNLMFYVSPISEKRRKIGENYLYHSHFWEHTFASQNPLSKILEFVFQ